MRKDTITGIRWDEIRFAATHEVTEWTETKPGNEDTVNPERPEACRCFSPSIF